MDNPFFSIVMPAFNAAEYIQRALDSVKRQDFESWEIVVFDDGSTDDTPEILNNNSNVDCRIRVFSQANAGPGVARANAIAKSVGRYIVILDADDYLSNGFLSKVNSTITSTNADIIVPDIKYVYPDGVIRRVNKFAEYNWNNEQTIAGGKYALDMTIPWRLHGHQIIKREFALCYYTKEAVSFNNYNSDEFITRILYYRCKKIALSSAEYCYYIGSDSVTRKPSLKRFQSLQTMDKLVDICNTEDVLMYTRIKVYNEYYVTLSNLKKNVSQFSEDDRKQAIYLLDNAYSNSYRKKMRFSMLVAAPLRTKIKFLLSLISIRFIR